MISERGGSTVEASRFKSPKNSSESKVTISIESGTGIIRQDFDKRVEVVVEKAEKQRLKPGEVALHEAAHVVAAQSSGGISEANNIRQGDALGTTRPVKLTAVSAAAAGALGYEGTSWDRFLTENYLGVPWSVAKAAARSELSGQEDLIEEVATRIEEERIIQQPHVDIARRAVNERRQGIFPVSVAIYQAGREVNFLRTKSFHGEVVVNLPETSHGVKA